MIILVAAIKAKAGKEKEFEEASERIVANVQNEDSALAYTFHKSIKNPGEFLFYEKYKDQASMDYHNSTPYFKEFFTSVGPLLDGEPKVDFYEEAASVKR